MGLVTWLKISYLPGSARELGSSSYKIQGTSWFNQAINCSMRMFLVWHIDSCCENLLVPFVALLRFIRFNLEILYDKIIISISHFKYFYFTFVLYSTSYIPAFLHAIYNSFLQLIILLSLKRFGEEDQCSWK